MCIALVQRYQQAKCRRAYNAPLPNHERVLNFIIADSLIFIAICRVAIDTSNTESELGLIVPVAKNLSTRW